MYRLDQIRVASEQACNPARDLGTVRAAVLIAAIAAMLSGCGGGGGDAGLNGKLLRGDGLAAASPDDADDDANTPAETSTPASNSEPTSAPATSAPPAPPTAHTPVSGTATVSIDRVYLAHALLFPSDDPELKLVAGKDLLILIDVTSVDLARAKPGGKVQVFDAAAVLKHDAALTPPEFSLSAVPHETPSLSSLYSAVVPGSAVAPGMKIELDIGDGQQKRTIRPSVGPGIAIKMVAVPLVMGTEQGSPPSAFHEEVMAKHPLASVAEVAHSPLHVAKSAPESDEEWKRAMAKIIAKLASLALSEEADSNTHYVGILPKSGAGVQGKGAIGGNVLVVADRGGHRPEAFRTTVVHELGHNFGLNHAPCGGATGADEDYPYPDGRLGGESRFIWGIDFRTKSLIDPHDKHQHDIMSYCENRESFSDYNYRQIQINLGEAKPIAAAFKTPPESLLLVSGTISDDAVELLPLKVLEGRPSLSKPGAYELRLITRDRTVQHTFAGDALSDSPESVSFAFSVPNPGSIVTLQIVRDGKLLFERTNQDQTLSDDVRLTSQELDGQLHLHWDATPYPFLTVMHVGSSRTMLAQDLEGGFGKVPLSSLPAGGKFEFILSDGLNPTRVVTAR